MHCLEFPEQLQQYLCICYSPCSTSSLEKPTAGNRFSLLFTVDNKPGKLAEVIQVIGASGFNMESIKSRPMPHVPFEYYFYVELVGDAAAGETAALLRELDRTCRTVRLLGVYTK